MKISEKMLPRRLRAASTILMLLASVMNCEAGDYLLGRGDGVEVTVTAGAQSVRRVQIGMNGAISMPLLGDVEIAGLSPSNAALKIATLYRERKIYDQVEAIVDVTSYRPVFITGTVAKPGPYDFRPGMTVRQLLAMAGEHEGGSGSEGPIPGVLRQEYADANAKYVAAQIRTARIRAEIEGGDRIDSRSIDFGESDMSAFAEVLDAEQEQMKQARENAEREQSHLSMSANQTREQIAALEKKIVEEAANVDLAQADLDRLKSAFSKGIVSAPRLGDTQQTLALVKIRHAEGIARLAETRRLLSETERRAERLKAEYSLNLLEVLRQQGVEVERARAAVLSARAKLERASVLPLRSSKSEIVISIFSVGSKGARTVDAASELNAGDTVSISRLSPTAHIR